MNPEKRRKVCVVLVDRANYGRLKPVMKAILEHPRLELLVLAAGTMVLERLRSPGASRSTMAFPSTVRLPRTGGIHPGNDGEVGRVRRGGVCQ